MKELGIGIIGFGTVGAGVADCLIKNGEVIAKRTGVKPVIRKIADLDIVRDRGVKVPQEVLTTDAMEAIETCEVIVELVGGTTFAKTIILEALKRGKPVVTANKALLAKYGEELFAEAEKSGADIFYEASVGGGIPIIKSLREGLVGNRINKIYGILNGTCNYILTRMERDQADFKEVLADAQKLGYAEANPSLDIDGFDTAHTATIAASLAYGNWFGMDPVYVEGLTEITLDEIKLTNELGYKIKLLAIIKQDNGNVEIRVHPTLIPKQSMLAKVDDVYNAVMVNGDFVGDTIRCRQPLQQGSADRQRQVPLLSESSGRGRAGRSGADHQHSRRLEHQHLQRCAEGTQGRRKRFARHSVASQRREEHEGRDFRNQRACGSPQQC